jgi:antitoxin MazE
MVAKAQIVKWGNSLAVRVPKVIAEEVQFREGDALVLEVIEGGLSLKREKRPPTLDELISQITPENLHGEVWAEKPVGKEVW